MRQTTGFSWLMLGESSMRRATMCACLAAATSLLRPTIAAQEAFEVASIKVADPYKNPVVLFQAYPGGRMVVTNFTLSRLVMEAYQLNSQYRVTGGPEWAQHGELWDITAKPPANSAAAAFRPPPAKESAFPYPNLPGGLELPGMMRNLLTERFRLKVHRETRQMTAVVLKVGKGAPKLEAAHDPSVDARSFGGKNQDEWSNFTMARLAEMLEAHYRRPVIDHTGLTGTYDFRLSYNPGISDTPDSAEPAADNAGVSFKSAVEKQLGLILEETKAPVEILVIDSASRPTAN